MKAIVYERYGPPDVLRLEDFEKPSPKDDEVLIKVRSVSLNASDWEFLTGRPIYTRAWGLLKPKHNILGSDIAGVVESVGRNVREFQPGDQVFGDIMEYWGGFAEYVCAPESRLTPKPDFITFEQAAAIPQAANVALQGLLDVGGIEKGQKVLINGAGGGSGSFAIQFAKLFGGEVTSVDTKEKFDFMNSLGSDHVMDYKKEDFTRSGNHYDLILNLIASHTILDYKRALSPGGLYVLAGGSVGHILQTLIFGSLISATGSRRMVVLPARANKRNDLILELIESGKIKPIIDRRYSLNEVPEALSYLGQGLSKGKVVINIGEG